MITSISSSIESLFGIDISLNNDFGLSIFQICPSLLFYFINNNNILGPKFKELKGFDEVNVQFNMQSYYDFNY